MTPLENLRKKYPQYDNIDDNTLIEKVIAKYPQYKGVLDVSRETSQPTEQPTETKPDKRPQDMTAIDKLKKLMQDKGLVSTQQQIDEARDVGLLNRPEAVKSLENVVSGTYQAIRHPIETAKGVAKLVEGVGNVIGAKTYDMPEEDLSTEGKGALDISQTLVKHLKDPLKTLTEHPFELAAFVGGLRGTPAKNLAQDAKTVIKKTVESPIGKKVSSLPEQVESIGKQLSVSGMNQQNINKISQLTDNSDVGYYATKNYPSSVKEALPVAEGIIDETYKLVDTQLSKVNKAVKNNDINMAIEDLNKYYNSPAFPASEFKTIQNELSRLKIKARREGLNLNEVNRLKRIYDNPESKPLFSEVTGKEYKGANKQSSIALRNNLQKTIEKEAADVGIENIGAMNKDIQMAWAYKNAFGKATDKALTEGLYTLVKNSGVDAINWTSRVIGNALNKISGAEIQALEIAKETGKYSKLAESGLNKVARFFRIKAENLSGYKQKTHNEIVEATKNSLSGKPLAPTRENKVKMQTYKEPTIEQTKPINTPSPLNMNTKVSSAIPKEKIPIIKNESKLLKTSNTPEKAYNFLQNYNRLKGNLKDKIIDNIMKESNWTKEDVFRKLKDIEKLADDYSKGKAVKWYNQN
jgi:hypothetical protein